MIAALANLLDGVRFALDRLAAQHGSESKTLGAMDFLAALVASLTSDEGDAGSRRLHLPAAWAGVGRETLSLRELSPALSDPSRRPSRRI